MPGYDDVIRGRNRRRGRLGNYRESVDGQGSITMDPRAESSPFTLAAHSPSAADAATRSLADDVGRDVARAEYGYDDNEIVGGAMSTHANPALRSGYDASEHFRELKKPNQFQALFAGLLNTRDPFGGYQRNIDWQEGRSLDRRGREFHRGQQEYLDRRGSDGGGTLGDDRLDWRFHHFVGENTRRPVVESGVTRANQITREMRDLYASRRAQRKVLHEMPNSMLDLLFETTNYNPEDPGGLAEEAAAVADGRLQRRGKQRQPVTESRIAILQDALQIGPDDTPEEIAHVISLQKRLDEALTRHRQKQLEKMKSEAAAAAALGLKEADDLAKAIAEEEARNKLRDANRSGSSGNAYDAKIDTTSAESRGETLLPYISDRLDAFDEFTGLDGGEDKGDLITWPILGPVGRFGRGVAKSIAPDLFGPDVGQSPSSPAGGVMSGRGSGNRYEDGVQDTDFEMSGRKGNDALDRLVERAGSSVSGKMFDVGRAVRDGSLQFDEDVISASKSAGKFLHEDMKKTEDAVDYFTDAIGDDVRNSGRSVGRFLSDDIKKTGSFVDVINDTISGEYNKFVDSIKKVDRDLVESIGTPGSTQDAEVPSIIDMIHQEHRKYQSGEADRKQARYQRMMDFESRGERAEGRRQDRLSRSRSSGGSVSVPGTSLAPQVKRAEFQRLMEDMDRILAENGYPVATMSDAEKRAALASLGGG